MDRYRTMILWLVSLVALAPSVSDHSLSLEESSIQKKNGKKKKKSKK